MPEKKNVFLLFLAILIPRGCSYNNEPCEVDIGSQVPIITDKRNVTKKPLFFKVGLREEDSRDLVLYLSNKGIAYSPENEQKAFFEMDTLGVDVLNLISSRRNYRVVSQSTVIEVSNIGGRTDKVQKTIWTLGK